MGMDGSGLSVADALALQDRKGGDDAMGGSGMWMMMFLFFILAMGGNGGLGGLGGANAATNQINNDFLYTNLKSSMDQGFGQVANQNFGMQKDMWQGFSGVESALCQGFNGTQRDIAESRFAAQQCCCETNRNIDAVRYENAKNTCDIITAGNANTQRIVDTMTQNTIQELRDQLQAAQLTIGNAAQTTTIINAVRPFPTPSYVTCSPYTAANGFGCGCNSGCGC